MHSSNHSVIGRRVANVDGWEKVTGSARYTVDMDLPGMLHGKILRSPHAHASIVRIDTSEPNSCPASRLSSPAKTRRG